MRSLFLCISGYLLIASIAQAQNAIAAAPPPNPGGPVRHSLLREPPPPPNARAANIDRTRSAVLQTPEGAEAPVAPQAGSLRPLPADSPSPAATADESPRRTSANLERDRLDRERAASYRKANRWRTVYHRGRYWYWTPEQTWLVWSGRSWVAYPETPNAANTMTEKRTGDSRRAMGGRPLSYGDPRYYRDSGGTGYRENVDVLAPPSRAYVVPGP